MKTDYKVGELIYDANIYDRLNTFLSDLQFYKKWLPTNKEARILELCCGTGRLTIPIAQEGYNICGVDYTPSMLEQAKWKATEAGLISLKRILEHWTCKRNSTLSLFRLTQSTIYIETKICLRR